MPFTLTFVDKALCGSAGILDPVHHVKVVFRREMLAQNEKDDDICKNSCLAKAIDGAFESITIQHYPPSVTAVCRRMFLAVSVPGCDIELTSRTPYLELISATLSYLSGDTSFYIIFKLVFLIDAILEIFKFSA